MQIKICEQSITIEDICFKCWYINPEEKDGYKCRVMGSCPAVDLSDKVQEEILKKYKEIQK